MVTRAELDASHVARPFTLRGWVARVGRPFIVMWLIWAGLPFAFVFGWYFTHLPGEGWGIGFVLVCLGMPWGLFGLGLFMTGLIERVGRGPRAVLAGVALALAVAGFKAALALPWEWSVAPLARARFALTEVEGPWMAVPGDSYFSGCGYFVQESPGESADGLVALEFHRHTIKVQRGRCARVEPSDSFHGDVALVVPVRAGWWYVYVDY